MKKQIIAILSLLILIPAAHSIAGASSFVYTLDVDIPEPEAILNVQERIGGLEFQVYGGIFGQDWNVFLGEAVPAASGNWIFENFNVWSAVYDDYSWSDPQYAPLASGNVLTIISATLLRFENLSFYDFSGGPVDTDYFTSQGFQENAVPVPGTFMLLGSGVMIALGVNRKKGKDLL